MTAKKHPVWNIIFSISAKRSMRSSNARVYNRKQYSWFRLCTVCYTYPYIVTADQLKCLVSVMHNKPWFINIIIIGHLYSPHKPNKIITAISPLDTFIPQHIYIFQTQFIFVVFHLEKKISKI